MLFSYGRGRQKRRKDRPVEKRQSRESQSQTSRKIDNAMRTSPCLNAAIIYLDRDFNGYPLPFAVSEASLS